MASLVLPSIPKGHVALNADHPYQLLPTSIKDWLARLGAMLPEGSDLRCSYTLSIACTVHQPYREATSTSTGLWYWKNICPGEVTVSFIPLSQGQIHFAILSDVSSRGPCVASLPNGFVRRRFPCKEISFRDSQAMEAKKWFLVRIWGADEHEPFAFASLVFHPLQQRLFVTIEILPAANTPPDDIQGVECLLKRFTNADHPCWQDSQVTDISPEPEEREVSGAAPEAMVRRGELQKEIRQWDQKSWMDTLGGVHRAWSCPNGGLRKPWGQQQGQNRCLKKLAAQQLSLMLKS